ncbi:MAG TPA: hypothetical protein PLE09_07350 [Caldisericia bacterium]|nr:hypothetical protein [Caldisericia bacterium]
MVRLTKIGILSYGYIAAVISAVISFLYVLLMFPMIQMLVKIFTNGVSESMDYGYGMGMGMEGMGTPGFDGISTGLFVALIILAPIIGAISGFIFGCLGAILYNLAAKWTGGIECNFEKVPEIDYSGKPSAYSEIEKDSMHTEDTSSSE